MTDPDPPAPLLPEDVRREVLVLAAEVLGRLPGADVPPTLSRIRQFAPARRARAGSGPLAAALEAHAAFRHAAAGEWRARHPGLAEELDAGRLPPAADPREAAVGLFLLRGPDWGQLLGRALAALAAQREQSAADTGAGAQTAETARAIDRLRGEAAALRDQLAAVEREAAQLRRQLRRLTADADRARAAARSAQAESAAAAEAAAEREQQQAAAIRLAEQRAQDAEQRAELARRAQREGQSLADARVRLLLDTVLDAAAGLRRELALPPASVLPGDLVADQLGDPPPAATDGVPLRGYAVDDPAPLQQYLSLPRAHLIVDGYNVTKTGYPAVTLAEQRRRLLDGLAPLAVRTSAEVTCCFDGAEVEGQGAMRQRGVRVLFSEPGTTADELIRRLVRAEPAGRPVIVVSSDGEVVADSRRAGARTASSAALLRLLAR